MKHISLLSAFAVIAGYATMAHSTTMGVYANGIATHNIAVVQHSIMMTTFNPLDITPTGTPSTQCGRRFACKTNETELIRNDGDTANPSLYGKMPLYGEMKYYGEYGDDGSVLVKTGRSGGDEGVVTETKSHFVGNLAVGWQHFDDRVKFDHMDRIDSKYDLISMGLVGGRGQINGGVSEWGLFGGFINANEDADSMSMTENGGYIGLYNGYSIHGVGLSLAANGGILHNKNEMSGGTDKFNNKWVGAALNITYNIAITDTFSIQPGMSGGYTWIKSANYTSVTGEKIENDNLKIFEMSYALRAIKHIGNNWYGILSGRYVANFANDTQINVNGAVLPELTLGNYWEYGAMIEKNIDRFNLGITINRRDGARAGWNGGILVKYIF